MRESARECEGVRTCQGQLFQQPDFFLRLHALRHVLIELDDNLTKIGGYSALANLHREMRHAQTIWQKGPLCEERMRAMGREGGREKRCGEEGRCEG